MQGCCLILQGQDYGSEGQPGVESSKACEKKQEKDSTSTESKKEDAKPWTCCLDWKDQP